MSNSKKEELNVIKGWSSDSQILESGRKILSKFQWDQLIAEKGYSDSVPEEAGLYIFSTVIKVGDYIYRNPFYIGESDYSIRDRFKDHIHKQEWKDMFITYGNKFTYSFYLVDKSDEDKLLEWETVLIKMFMPKHNLKISKKSSSSEAK